MTEIIMRFSTFVAVAIAHARPNIPIAKSARMAEIKLCSKPLDLLVYQWFKTSGFDMRSTNREKPSQRSFLDRALHSNQIGSLSSFVSRNFLRRYRSRGGQCLEVISAGKLWHNRNTAILFVHGAFGGAWMWQEHFLRYFGKTGRKVYALSLRGHGRSDGREQIKRWRFSDYSEDVRQVVEQIGTPIILVGHSLGGLIVQRLIGLVPMRAMVLMASAPPEGTFLAGNSLILPHPTALLENILQTRLDGKMPVADLWRRALFSKELPAKQVVAFAARLGPESPRALADARVPGPVLPARSVRIPSLVLAADGDRIIERSMAHRTAVFHGARLRIVKPSGHAIMLDASWRKAAEIIHEWLKDHGM